jgi:hypothetical protein
VISSLKRLFKLSGPALWLHRGDNLKETRWTLLRGCEREAVASLSFVNLVESSDLNELEQKRTPTTWLDLNQHSRPVTGGLLSITTHMISPTADGLAWCLAKNWLLVVDSNHRPTG